MDLSSFGFGGSVVRRVVWNSQIGQAAPEFLVFFEKSGFWPLILDAWSCLASQHVVEAVFPPQRISEKKSENRAGKPHTRQSGKVG
jgi:hypothetical protein